MSNEVYEWNSRCYANIFLFVTACSNGEQVKEISHIELGAFKKYTGTYVGNNTDVLAIVKNLPGGEIVKPTLE